LEILADFAVLAEMVSEVAKWKYREQNPTRKRVPRGFEEGISLRLTGVESGSVIPVIGLFTVAPTGLGFPHSSTPYYDSARQAIVEAVEAASRGKVKEITAHLPQRLLGYFDRFGRNLIDGEAIELSDPPSGITATLTRDTRRKLLLASTAEEFAEEVSVHGLVHEFDQRKRTFELTIADGTILPQIPVEEQHYDSLLEASNGFRDGLRVRVSGVGRYDRSNRLQRLESVEHVVVLDPLDIGVRIDELKLLKEGWLDGKGVPPARQGLDWLEKSFDVLYPADVALPYLFPTPEGRVLAEWSLPPWAPSVEIDLVAKSGDWHALNLETDAEDTRTLDLSNPTGWEWLAEQIRGFGTGSA